MSAPNRLSGTSRLVEGRGIRLHFLEHGQSGEPLVILPGITSPAATWAFVAEPLSDERRVITWDARGRGLSDHPGSGYALPDFVADLKMFLDMLDLERPALLAHSMGARIAAHFAAENPQRVGPLILADPPMMGPDRPLYSISLDDFLGELKKARDGELTIAAIANQWPSWDEDRLRERVEWLPTCGEVGVRESYEAMQRDDFLVPWRRLTAPLLLVRGSDSPAISAADEAELLAANQAAEAATVGHAGHMIPFENRNEFLEVIRRFLTVQLPGG